MKNLISIHNLSKSFGKIKALDNISLEVKKGEVLAFIGPSGCGKTTLLNCISGITEADEGDILLNSKNITNTPIKNRKIGVVFQDYALFDHLDVFGNISFPLKTKVNRRKNIQELAEAMLELTNLQGYENRKISELSGGEKQRVALARALIFEPQILLLDEPMAAIDSILKKQIIKEFQRIQRATSITTMYITHDLEEAMIVADRIAIMNEGKIVQLGKPDHLYSYPMNSFTGKILGDANIYVIKELKSNGGKTVLKISETLEFEISEKNAKKYNATKKQRVLIRPEKVNIIAEEDNSEKQGYISDMEFVGAMSLFQITADNIQINSKMVRQEGYIIGQKVAFDVSKEDIIIIDI